MLLMFAFFAGAMLVAGNVWSKDWKNEGGLARVFGFGLAPGNALDFVLIVMLVVYAALFLTITKRAEDTSRFSLMWAPVIAIVAARYFDEAYKFIKNFRANEISTILSIAIVVAILFWCSNIIYTSMGIVATFIFIGATVFIFFLTKNPALSIFILIIVSGIFIGAQKINSMYNVKQFSSTFFEACDWIKANTPENATLSTVWSYRAAYNCQRNSVGSEPDMALSYNVTTITATAKELGITHIFVQKFSLSNEALSESYPVEYVRLLEANPDKFKKVYENGPSLETCLQQGGCDGNIVYEIV
jgi:hypothetical protein